MGRKGREIVQMEIKGIIEDLQKALSLEWQAAYYFWYCSKVAEGIESKPIAEFFKEQVKEEMGHASRLAERILELGGTPLNSPDDWSKYSEYREPVKASDDLEGMIRGALEIEASAIELYHDLSNRTRHKDVVTHELAEDILIEEVHEEEELENFLGGTSQPKGHGKKA